MSPPPPKTKTDEKMESHFNGIVVAVLAIVAIAILIAILFIFRKGSKAGPSTHPQSVMIRPVEINARATG